MPSAEIIAVGTEILLGDIVDTNSQLLGKAFAEYGIDHKRRATVGDRLERCAAVITEALARADIVVTIGGLGPTEDDITRDAIAAAVGEELVTDENALAFLKKWVAGRGRKWRDAYARQAMRPQSATCLPNDAGTAPGIHWHVGDKHVIAMPGPRNEFLGMLEKSVRPILASQSDSVIYSRTLRILGIPEATLGELFAKEMESENPTVSPYAKVGEVHLRITAKARDQKAAEALIAPVAASISAELGDAVYSDKGEELTKVIIDKLNELGETMAVAESCTGGLLGARITVIPGASEVFEGGVISYSNRVKSGALGVSKDDLDRFGAVSEPVARQMSEGVRRALATTYGISITGLAGPGGETAEKPIGLVYVSVAGPNGTKVEENRFRGDRDHIRELSVHRALALLWGEIRSR